VTSGRTQETAVSEGEAGRENDPSVPHAAPVNGLWFSVLGPVRCWHDGVELGLGTPAQRAIVGVLLLREGQVVTAEEIAEALWGDDPPASASSVVRTYIYRLRRLLPTASDGEALIRSVGGGYALPVAAESVDCRMFAELVSRARTARRDDPPRSRQLLIQALGLWTGTALSGLRGSYLERQRRRLEQDRFGAWEERLAADVELGYHHEVIPELVSAVGSHPLRERLQELLMLALYRAGRQAESLAAYADARRILDEELGVSPGSGLQRLHERILRMDPTLEPPRAPESDSDADSPVVPNVPSQLPADLPDFVGRDAEIAAIERLMNSVGRVPAVGLAGLGGMGKTVLAVHCAHLLRERFPDGQLFAGLGAVSGTPADPSEVLAAFLRACGIRPALVPQSLSERATLWRTVTAGKRILVVLDDAASAEQIRHLLPAEAGCASIVTTWRRFIDLPGTTWLTVDVMTPRDAVTLLGRACGEERIAAEPGPAARLVAACSHQPLAVRVAAARLNDRPHWTVVQIENQLYEDLRQPVVMHDDCEIVDAPFRYAENRLADDVAAAFRLLAVPDCARLTVPGVAAMLGLPRIQALATLERLVDAHLLIADSTDSYRFHGLIKAYARRQAGIVEGPERCRAVVCNLAAFYMAMARSALYLINGDKAGSGAPLSATVVARRAAGLIIR